MRKLSCTLLGSDTPVDYLENYIARVPYLQMLRNYDCDGQSSDETIMPQTDLLFCEPGHIGKINQLLSESDRHALIVCLVSGQGDDYSKLDDSLFSVEHHPLSFERFLTLIERARLYIYHQKSLQLKKASDFVFVKSEYKMIRIKFSDILYCEGLKDYTQIHIEGKNLPVLTLQNLKSFAAKLPTDEFIRIHRSYLVALRHIEMIGRNEVIVGKKPIPIGNSFRENFFAAIEQYT